MPNPDIMKLSYASYRETEWKKKKGKTGSIIYCIFYACIIVLTIFIVQFIGAILSQGGIGCTKVHSDASHRKGKQNEKKERKERYNNLLYFLLPYTPKEKLTIKTNI